MSCLFPIHAITDQQLYRRILNFCTDGVLLSQVGCTVLGSESALLRERFFDVCILDEAGQVTLPACLGALLKARSFALVGDHKQLEPLVQNREAGKGGLAASLFSQLAGAHPEVR